ncbi:MAG: protein kinase, partial [Candidatus Aminicenantes bacterium]|nr:protein kinase [Candidatus Aminicenantes bacterium]
MTITCSKCKTRNTDKQRFCGECGAQLTQTEDVAAPTRTLEIPIPEMKAGIAFADRYEILEELGAGGMGKVYRAKDKKINEEIALKIIKPEVASDVKTIERFSHELKLARKISHRHVCRMYEFMEAGGIHYISMEYVSGKDLKRHIQEKGPLSEKDVRSIAKQVCTGLMEAHRMGIVHRDLKPGNIMIENDGQAKIMDFGIARSLHSRGLTVEGMIVGTPEYMSPEQVNGEEVDQRSDIYSLGAVLFEMITGRVLFEGESAFSVALKQKNEIPPDPQDFNPETSTEFSSVILKCLAKNREERYSSVEELLSDLNALEKGVGISEISAKIHMPGFMTEEQQAEIDKPVFVARDVEMTRLLEFLEKAVTGKGQVVFVTGEAGSGKTALMKEFCRKAQEGYPDLIIADGKCNAHSGIGDPYLPFREVLGLLTGDVEAKWKAGILSSQMAQRLWKLTPSAVEAVLDCGYDLINTFVAGSLLVSRSGLFVSPGTDWLVRLKKAVERKSELPPDSSLQQSDLFEQYTRTLLSLTRENPILLVLDDLQWVDAGSASLLFHLGRRLGGSRVMVVGLFRSDEVTLGRGEERHPLETVIHELKRDFGDIELELSRSEARTFVDAYIDAEANCLDDSFRATLFRHTGGHPLFTVELLREMQDRGMLFKDEKNRWVQSSSLDWNTLPARVDAVIEERISRLNEKLREILTVASIEGEEFTAEVIARFQEIETRKLIRLLSADLDRRHHLVSAKGIRQLRSLNLSLYFFRHILFQRYLYNSLDAVERSHLHAEVGEILEGLFGEQKEEASVQLARHFMEAGLVEKAVEYLHKAGDRAVRLSANAEAMVHYKNALKLLEELPENPERDQSELNLQLAYFVPVAALRGIGDAEATRAIFRARELCDRIGETPLRFTALVQFATHYAFSRAEYRKALELKDQIVAIAEQTGDPLQKAISSYVTVWSWLNVGELDKVVEHANRMNATYDPRKHGFLAYLFGFDLGVINRGLGSWALWFLGYPDQARRQIETALEHAHQLGHPHTVAFALVGACELYWFMRDKQGIDRCLDELTQVSNEKGFFYWQAHSVFYQGERSALAGKVSEGIDQMQQGLDKIRTTGILTCFTRLLARLASVCLQTERIEEGLSALEEAIAIKCRFDESYMEAELYRLKGELLLKKDGDENEILKLFDRSLKVARQQKAKSLELR